MNTDNITVNIHSSIRIELNKVLYFDPFKIEKEVHDADIILITHNHYDHLDIESINKVIKDNTIIIAPKSIEKDITIGSNNIYLNPFDEINIDNINIKTIPAYNIGKPYHQKEFNWLGYIVTYNNISYYIAGDTDKIEEAKKVKCNIAFIPIGGKFTMDVNEATELLLAIKPQVVIPIHYGSIVGSIEDAKILKNNLSNTEIKVIEKIQ